MQEMKWVHSICIHRRETYSQCKINTLELALRALGSAGRSIAASRDIRKSLDNLRSKHARNISVLYNETIIQQVTDCTYHEL